MIGIGDKKVAFVMRMNNNEHASHITLLLWPLLSGWCSEFSDIQEIWSEVALKSAIANSLAVAGGCKIGLLMPHHAHHHHGWVLSCFLSTQMIIKCLTSSFLQQYRRPSLIPKTRVGDTATWSYKQSHGHNFLVPSLLKENRIRTYIILRVYK